MNRQIMRVAAGANLVAGCLLLQGCGMFGKPKDHTVTQVPDGDLPPVEVQTLEPAAPVETMPVVETAPAALPTVPSTTPYTIQKGDTISSVAYKYSLRWQDVVAVNPGISPNRLRIGQVIQLPGQVDLGHVRKVPVATPRAPRVSAPKVSAPKTSTSTAAVTGPATTYVVKPGDSLSVIAYRHGIKTADLRAVNGLKGDKIVVGQKLKIVGATKKPAATTKASAAAPKMAAPKATAAAPNASEVKPKETVVAPPPAPAPAPAAVETAAPVAPVESAPVKIDAAAPAPAAAADPNVQTYTVKEGEDLYAVAIRWGVSPSDLKALNNLTSSELKAGTVLKIPGGVQ